MSDNLKAVLAILAVAVLFIAVVISVNAIDKNALQQKVCQRMAHLYGKENFVLDKKPIFDVCYFITPNGGKIKAEETVDFYILIEDALWHE